MARGWMYAFISRQYKEIIPARIKKKFTFRHFLSENMCRLHPAARFGFCSDPFYVTVMQI